MTTTLKIPMMFISMTISSVVIMIIGSVIAVFSILISAVVKSEIVIVTKINILKWCLVIFG